MISADTLTLQTIPPATAHFCLKVENFVADDLKVSLHDKALLVALSGGIDSTALLIILHLLRQRLNSTLSAAHLNHGIRPEAEQDQAFCQKLCSALSIPFHTRTIDVPALCRNGAGLEETARTTRYDYLFSLKSTVHYDYLVTGHQLNDLAEDCLMRLIRGAGWPALGGMTAFDERKTILRPLLLQPKADLTHLLSSLGIPHVEDASNTDMFSLRNRVRLKIIPLLMAENPSFLERIATLWKQAQMDKDSLTEILAPILQEATAGTGAPRPYPCQKHAPSAPSPCGSPPLTLYKDHLLSLPKSFRVRAYKAALDMLGEGQVPSDTLLKLDQAWVQKKSRAVFQFGHGKTANIHKQSIIFYKE